MSPRSYTIRQDPKRGLWIAETLFGKHHIEATGQTKAQAIAVLWRAVNQCVEAELEKQSTQVNQ